MSLILFEEFTIDKKLYRGISKQELTSACSTGTLSYSSVDGRVSLTPDINFARKFSNYVVEINCSNVEKISNNEYKADSPENCIIVSITEFDTTGNIINKYDLKDFCRITNETY